MSKTADAGPCCVKVPTPPTAVGTVTLCKIAGAGVAPGALFVFSVNGGPFFNLGAGVAPGTCVALGSFPAGTDVTIQERLPDAKGAPTLIVVTPPGALVSSSIVTGKTVVTVQDGLDVNVTYTDTLEGG